MANIEKRSENTYRIVVSTGYDASGKKLRKYKTVTLPDGMTERQREKELNRQSVLFEQAVEAGTYLDGAKMTFADLTQKWIEVYAEKHLSPATLKTYKTRIEQRILPALGHLKLNKIQPHHLMGFYSDLEECGMRLDMDYIPTTNLINLLKQHKTLALVKSSGLTFKTCQNIKNGGLTTRESAEKLCTALNMDIAKMFEPDRNKKLSPKTIRHHHGIISAILSSAVKWNLIDSNPAQRVDLGKMKKYKAAYYDDAQITTMLAALEQEPLCYKTMVLLAIDTGMRSGEIMGLRWSDVDLDKRILSITKQRQYVSGYGVFEKEPKTENGVRTITLSKTAISMLQSYRSQQIKEMFCFGVAWTNNQVIFTHEDGTSMHPHRPYKWFTDFLRRHDLPKITFHQLRHTNASLLISAGVDIVTLSGRLGHGDKNVTLNTYSHIIKSREEQAANQMDAFYSKVK